MASFQRKILANAVEILNVPFSCEKNNFRPAWTLVCWWLYWCVNVVLLCWCVKQLQKLTLRSRPTPFVCHAINRIPNSVIFHAKCDTQAWMWFVVHVSGVICVAWWSSYEIPLHSFLFEYSKLCNGSRLRVRISQFDFKSGVEFTRDLPCFPVYTPWNCTDFLVEKGLM
jgi:hypothetical protein